MNVWWGEVSDQEIMDAKAVIGQGGIGCEPASAASVAGLKKFRESGVIEKSATAVCIITGHQLKAPHPTVAYHSLTGDALAKEFADFGVTKKSVRQSAGAGEERIG